MKKQKNNKKMKILRISTYILLFLIFVYSGSRIYVWNNENNKTKIIQENLKDITKLQKSNNEINFEKLKSQNSDTVFYLKVNNTNISYPIVKYSDNNYYLNHSFDKSKNSAGWLFADYKNKLDGTDKNIVVYGHNRRDGSMFGTLKNILNKEWYDNTDNMDIVYMDIRGKHIYKVFSIYKIENEDYYITTQFNNDIEYKKFLTTIKSRSIKDFNVEISETDSILTLSTCANNNKYRVVLHAKRI